MFYEYEKLIALMQSLAKEIDGHYFGNKSLNLFGVIKDDFLIQYRFPSRDHMATFSVMTPCILEDGVRIVIDRFNKISLHKRYYKNDQFDISIIGENKEYSEKLVDSLLNDFTFMANFKQLFSKDDQIDISENTLTIYVYRAIESTFASVGVMPKEELIRMINILKEMKASLEYFKRRYNG